MGLDVSHNCWSGSYGAFMRWRETIARCIGIPLQCMEGFYEWQNITQDDIYVERKMLFKRHADESEHGEWVCDALHIGICLPLKWESFKPSALHILLHHSDCEGKINWQDCKGIADELEKIIPLLPQQDAGGHIGNWKDKTELFVDGLRDAYQKKENLIFQ